MLRNRLVETPPASTIHPRFPYLERNDGPDAKRKKLEPGTTQDKEGSRSARSKLLFSPSNTD